MRRPVKNRNMPKPDLVYKNERLGKFINCIMWDGKKETARKVVYDALNIVKEKTASKDPLEVFDTALRNAGPTMEVRSRRIGGANYQVPREVRLERKNALAMRWIISAALSGTGRPM